MRGKKSNNICSRNSKVLIAAILLKDVVYLHINIA